VLDPTAGDGALMAGWPRERRFGVESDPDRVEAGDYSALRGDLQRLYPLLRLAGARFPAVVCNPPFGFDWQDPASGRRANSTALCLRFALGLLEQRGQGLLIAGRDRYYREIEPLAEARGVWCTIDGAARQAVERDARRHRRRMFTIPDRCTREQPLPSQAAVASDYRYEGSVGLWLLQLYGSRILSISSLLGRGGSTGSLVHGSGSSDR
jgi:predicted RNA methylase